MKDSANNNGNRRSTPAYRLRANAAYSKLRTLCHRWMVKHRPEVVEKLRGMVKKDAKFKEDKQQ